MFTYFGIGVFFALVIIVLYAFKEKGYNMDFFEDVGVHDTCDLGSLAFLLVVLWPAVFTFGLAFYLTGIICISAGDFIQWLLKQIEKLIKGKNDNDNC